MVSIAPSSIHGTGAFAEQFIPSGQKVLQYIGEKISKRESVRRCSENNEYIFFLNEEFDLDGNVPENQARFLNHSCSPNCVAELMDGEIWILARRDIHSGEELTFDYGYDLEFFREHPCHCGAPNCCGYVLAESLRKQGI
jgi:SET domain-containing protein